VQSSKSDYEPSPPDFGPNVAHTLFIDNMTAEPKRTAAAAKARILVVDDHPMVRDGLIRLISRQKDLVCCAEAGSAAEAQRAVAREKPDLVILDLRLRGGDGLQLIKTLKTDFPGLRILILSQFEEPQYIERSLRAGAMGYIVKDQAADEVLQAIRTVLAGDLYVTRGMAALLLHRFVGTTPKVAPSTALAPLSDRELHVLQLLGAGLSTREIAAELSLSFKTIATHRENIKRKLGLRGAAALIHFATGWARGQIALPSQALTEPAPRPRRSP
jgi:DNA-binding NarL/FixJ family response regulator